MKNFKFAYVLVPLLVFGAFSCSESFLNQPAKGSLSTSQLLSQAGVQQDLIGAYNALNGQGSWGGTLSGWVFGGVVGQEAYKGSNSGDQSDINAISTFTPTSTNNYLAQKWSSTFNGVVRANGVIRLIASLPKGVVSDADQKTMINEARFLRGVFNLEGRKVFKNIPYIDESIDYTLGNYNVANDKEVYPYIIADFKAAYANLPATASNPGRANKWAAAAFLGKTYLYAAGHLKTAAYYDSAYSIFQTVIASGTTAKGAAYALNAKFRDCFDAANDNNAESIFAIQASVNDGSQAANSNADLNLNFPYNVSPFCCGFYQPSADLANSYRTTAAGLPILDGTFNSAANQLTDVQWTKGATSVAADPNPLDPRIDWIIGRTGVPFFDWGTYPGPPWVRQVSDAGPYGGKKLVFPLSELGVLTDADGWGAIGRAVNYNLMRYSDLLLMAAEAATEKSAPDLAFAATQVDKVRTRAANPAGFVVVSKTAGKSDWAAYLDPTVTSAPAGNYKITTYGSFASVAAARIAIHMERKIELGMEGHRFFDLVRWGEIHAGSAPDNLESAYLYNSSVAGSVIYNNKFTFVDGRNEYFPIPQGQIDLSQGKLQQNFK